MQLFKTLQILVERMAPGTIVKRVISGFVMVIKNYSTVLQMPLSQCKITGKSLSGPSASRDVVVACLTSTEAGFKACRSSWRLGCNTVAVSPFKICSLRRPLLSLKASPSEAASM